MRKITLATGQQAEDVVLKPNTVDTETDEGQEAADRPYHIRRVFEDIERGSCCHVTFDDGKTWYDAEVTDEGELISVGEPIDAEFNQYLDWIEEVVEAIDNGAEELDDTILPPALLRRLEMAK